jgi:hypothetical protein
MKRCPKCGEYKPEFEFNRGGSKTLGAKLVCSHEQDSSDG